MSCLGCFSILGAIPGFFLSSFFLMLFWGIIAPDLEISTIGYPKAMFITFVLWLAVAPLVTARRK